MRKSLNDKMHLVVVLRNVTEKEQCFILQDKPKGVVLKPGDAVSATVSDLLTLLKGDKFFYGTDSRGSYATVLIENDEIREALGFIETDDKGEIKKNQLLLTKETFLSCVKTRKKEDFELFVRNISSLSEGNKLMLQRFLEEEKEDVGNITAKRMEQLKEAIKFI